jgi:hypothetical protein
LEEEVLQDKVDRKDDDEQPVVEEVLKHVELSHSDLSAIDQIEKLQTHEGLEHYSEDLLFAQGSLLFGSRYIQTRFPGEFRAFSTLRTESNSCKEHDKRASNCVPQSHADDMSPGHFIQNLFVWAIWLLVSNHALSGWLCRKSNNSEHVHQKVDVQKLVHKDWGFAEQQNSNKVDDNAREVCGYLEDQESSQVLVNISSPHNRSQHGFHVVVDKAQFGV